MIKNKRHKGSGEASMQILKGKQDPKFQKALSRYRKLKKLQK